MTKRPLNESMSHAESTEEEKSPQAAKTGDRERSGNQHHSLMSWPSGSEVFPGQFEWEDAAVLISSLWVSRISLWLLGETGNCAR